MKRLLSALALLGLLLAVSAAPAAAAPPQFLPEIGYKYYFSRDLVFVDFVNPYFTSVNNIIVNMIVRDGTPANRMIAIGQTRLPPTLILRPGDHTSARVPIRARLVRDIPVNATFEFRITGKVVADEDLPPTVTVQSGSTLEVSRDQNGVPYVMGFAALDPLADEDVTAQVEMAVLTFYDAQRRISWSEIMALSATLAHGDSLMVFSKYDAATMADVASVDVQFITVPENAVAR